MSHDEKTCINCNDAAPPRTSEAITTTSENVRIMSADEIDPYCAPGGPCPRCNPRSSAEGDATDRKFEAVEAEYREHAHRPAEAMPYACVACGDSIQSWGMCPKCSRAWKIGHDEASNEAYWQDLWEVARDIVGGKYGHDIINLERDLKTALEATAERGKRRERATPDVKATPPDVCHITTSQTNSCSRGRLGCDQDHRDALADALREILRTSTDGAAMAVAADALGVAFDRTVG